MTSAYLTIFIIGLVVVLMITVLSEIVDSILDVLWAVFLMKNVPILNPVSFFTALTVFGGTGYALTKFSEFHTWLIFFGALGLALLTIIALYYLIIKPKDRSETSLSYSMKQLVGLRASVTVPIPADGFGEVLIKLGGGNSNQIAASYDHTEISSDEEVFVVDEKEGVVYVSILKI